MTRAEIIARRLVDCGLLDTGKPEMVTKIMEALDKGRIFIIANPDREINGHHVKQWIGAMNEGARPLSEIFTPEQITECKLS